MASLGPNELKGPPDVFVGPFLAWEKIWTTWAISVWRSNKKWKHKLMFPIKYFDFNLEKKSVYQGFTHGGQVMPYGIIDLE